MQTTRRSLLTAVRAELRAAGKINSALGQQALILADKIANAEREGSGLAALSRELRDTMTAALRTTTTAADPLDELKAKRDVKRAAG